MKKTFFLLVLGLFCLLPLSVFAIDFKINSYQGDLYIHADNTAEFRQKIVYPQLFTPNLKTIQNPCLSLDPGWFLFSPNGCFLLDKKEFPLYG
ncbi:hypothetical protein PTT37_10500, partial [Streptococcus pneumoniae]|uniref:hypothetical protein n=1 Tax=Streptococcus pneumoniae TaxID=1313 RepID=UPI003081936D|nr:hypothetical protein [Streptococcus pneumoniae]